MKCLTVFLLLQRSVQDTWMSELPAQCPPNGGQKERKMTEGFKGKGLG